MIAEKKTNSNLEDLVQTRLLDKLGMNHTQFPVNDEIIGNYSHGYRDQDHDGSLEDITAVNPSLPWAGGGMVSNIYDLKTWVKEMYFGELLTPATQNMRLEKNTVIPEILYYGMGIMKLKEFWGHNGSILGYSDIAMYLPSKDAVIVCMMNKRNDDGDTRYLDPDATHLMVEIAKILYPDEF